MDNDLAAAAIASGPTEASLTGERLGIFKEVDNLDFPGGVVWALEQFWQPRHFQRVPEALQVRNRQTTLLWGSCANFSLKTIFFAVDLSIQSC